MRTLQISTMDVRGGAAKAAFRVFKGLAENGVDSHMLVLGKESGHPDVHGIRTDSKTKNKKLDKQFKLIQQYYIKANRPGDNNTLYTFGYPGRDISRNPQVVKADLLNLHMVDSILTPVSLAKLAKVGKPVVWTLHDEYPFTGGYHYSGGNSMHIGNDKVDHQLEDNPFNIGLLNLQDKIRLWKNWDNLTIVSPSKWLAEESKKSKLFKGKRVEVIANGHPLDTYYPEDKSKAKLSLGLPRNGFTILFGAANGNERRKGFKEMSQTINKMMEMDLFQQLHRQHLLTALVIGTPSEILNQLPIPVVTTGKINDDNKMRMAYSAADIFIFPSLEENLSNMLLESMACGVVPIAFDIGGNRDAIEHNHNGYLVELKDVNEMAEAAMKLAKDGSQLPDFSRNAVATVREKFEQNTQTSKYLELYEDILKKSTPSKVQSKVTKDSPMSYDLGPNLKKVYPDLIKYTKKAFKEEIQANKPSSFDNLTASIRSSVPARAVKKLIRIIRRKN